MIRITTWLVTTAVLAFSPIARADLSKEECLDAHSRGQDAKEQNKLSLARKLFLTCAQSSCPQVVQGDCARFADDLSRLQPSVTFIARDEVDRWLHTREVIGEPRAVALHERRARRLRARQEQLARERQLVLLACILTAAVRVDAHFLRHLVGVRRARA